MVARAVTSGALAALFLAAPAAASPPPGSYPLPEGPPPPGRAASFRALASPADDARIIRRGLARAVAAGRLSRAEASRYRAIVSQSRGVMSNVRGTRAATLARVLWLVRLQAGVYNRPRALTLFGMLRENARYLARRGVPRDGTDVVGSDGVVLRAGWGFGLQFHPLANMIRLNSHLYAGRRAQAQKLAEALIARAVPLRHGGAVWEYLFPYAGGRAPWTSGMAQAIGAQAFARAGAQLGRTDFTAAARRAFVSIAPRHVMQVSTGPWVRLYCFCNLVVLNAQLQAVLSVRDYSRITGDVDAGKFVTRLEASSRALLPRFDTGYWTRYSPSREAPLEYHRYHVDLTMWLARRTLDPVWADAHQRLRPLHTRAAARAGRPARARDLPVAGRRLPRRDPARLLGLEDLERHGSTRAGAGTRSALERWDGTPSTGVPRGSRPASTGPRFRPSISRGTADRAGSAR